MTIIPVPGADLATERALFEIDCRAEVPNASQDAINTAWETGNGMMWRAAYRRAHRAAVPASEPVDMILHCPSCGLQHIDAPDDRTTEWTNPPHKSHLCHGCSHIWRPADVPTNGVAAIKTKGKADSPTAAPAPVSGMPDLACLQRYFNSEFGVEKFSRAQHKNMPSIETYFLATDVERLLKQTGETK